MVKESYWSPEGLYMLYGMFPYHLSFGSSMVKESYWSSEGLYMLYGRFPYHLSFGSSDS